MNISNTSASQVSSTVWNAATRTLTNDPATDAGAATLVWTHATRTLSSDPATDAGAATLVWTHATRTLSSDPATDAGAATLVWTHATRTVTDPNSGNLNFETAKVQFTTSASQGVFGSYVQLIASLAHNVRALLVCVSWATADDCTVAFSTGGAGSEVDKSFFRIVAGTINQQTTFYIPVDATLHAKASRLAVHGRDDQAAVAVTFQVAVTCIEDNA